MSRCVYCQQRKGKRSCPALTGLICSQCCGEHRTDANLPVLLTAPISIPGATTSRSGSANSSPRFGGSSTGNSGVAGGEKAAALFNLIEVVTFGYFHDRRDGQDAEVFAAIQALRRTLSPLHVPSAPMPVFAERLKKEYDTFVKQQPQQMADAGSAPEILDRALALLTEFSGQDFQSRRFLNGMIGYVKTFHPEIAEHLTKQHEAGRIVLPGQLTPPPQEPTHVHGPECRHHHH